MTALDTRAAAPVRGALNPSSGMSAADNLTARLREAAGRLVPFSEHKILLRAAASAIERLDIEVRNGTTAIARLTAELNALR